MLPPRRTDQVPVARADKLQSADSIGQRRLSANGGGLKMMFRGHLCFVKFILLVIVVIVVLVVVFGFLRGRGPR